MQSGVSDKPGVLPGSLFYSKIKEKFLPGDLMSRMCFRNRLFVLVVFSFVIGSFSSAIAKTPIAGGAEAAAAAPTVSYTVSMSKPWTHLLEVEMLMSWDSMPRQAEVKMAVWTPGSYLIREYARHVMDFGVVDGSGKSLNWRKINKNTWQIDTNGAKTLKIAYEVYANELTVRTNELNDEHAFFTPAALFMYPKGQLSAPSTVKVVPYGNWRAATGLKSTGKNTFTAPNYDILFDSPFEVSDFKEKKFMVRGVPHRYVVTGEGNYDLDRIAEDTTKIIEQTLDIFGEIPYEDYTFILNMRGGGGLEHLNSTALQFNRWAFASPQGYNSFLGLVAHEYFHLFNVKRLRPDPLGPFDYENENYSKLLWVAEGATSYYTTLLMRRAGLTDATRFRQEFASIAQSLAQRPGRLQTSLEEASFDAWIKAYRTDENAINNQISYYSKGELVNFLLDVQIRAGSSGSKSLDDVMRYLYAENYKKGKTFTPEDYKAACELMADRSLDGFFAKYVSGREDIEYDELLAPIGLKMVTRNPESNAARLGANLSGGEGGITISSIPVGTAAHEAGLNSGDLIIAVDGFQTRQTSNLNFFINSKKAGDKITVTVFRHNKLREFVVTLGRTPASGYSIVAVDDPTEAQKKLYQDYVLDSLK